MRKKIINARLHVAIPFRTTEERDKFLSEVEAQTEKTIGEFVLELIREDMRQRDGVRRLTGHR